MTMDELMQKVLEIIPDAIFDEEFRSGEIMISTGLVVSKGKLVSLVPELPVRVSIRQY